MKKNILPHGGFFVVIALLSFLFMKYYERTLYFKPINRFIDIIYGYIATPFFYYFTAASVTIFGVYLFKINLSEKTIKIIKTPLMFVLIVYALFVFSNIIGILSTKPIFLNPLYSIFVIIVGSLSALTIKLKL